MHVHSRGQSIKVMALLHSQPVSFKTIKWQAEVDEEKCFLCFCHQSVPCCFCMLHNMWGEKNTQKKHALFFFLEGSWENFKWAKKKMGSIFYWHCWVFFLSYFIELPLRHLDGEENLNTLDKWNQKYILCTAEILQMRNLKACSRTMVELKISPFHKKWGSTSGVT